MTSILTAALDLIREGDIVRTLAAVGRDTSNDHNAHYKARYRYERARRRRYERAAKR